MDFSRDARDISPVTNQYIVPSKTSNPIDNNILHVKMKLSLSADQYDRSSNSTSLPPSDLQ